MHLLNTLLYLVLVLFKRVNGQHDDLRLFSYNQSMCITDCVDGLRQRVDNLIMIGEVNWKNIPSEYTRAVSVEIGGKVSFAPLCEIFFDKCIEENVHGCYCVRNKAPHLYYIYINVTAAYKMSEHLIVLTISSLDQFPNITSNASKLPRIYGNTLPTMHVNNYVLSQSTSTFVLKKSAPNIRLCCYDSPEPCIVTITRNDQLVAQSTQCVTFHDDHPEKASYNFTFIVCGNTNESISFICRADLSIDLQTGPYTVWITIKIFFIICVFGLISCCFRFIF